MYVQDTYPDMCVTYTFPAYTVMYHTCRNINNKSEFRNVTAYIMLRIMLYRVRTLLSVSITYAQCTGVQRIYIYTPDMGVLPGTPFL